MFVVHCVFYATSIFASLFHPLHMSVTDIEYDEKEKSLEIMSRVFMDDLEVALRESFQIPDLDVLAPKGRTLDDLMREYIKTRLSISLDQKRQRVNYLGHEADGDLFIFYIEVSGIKKWREIQVSNSLLMEKFEDQSNMVHVTVRGDIKSLRLRKDSPTGKLSFDQK